jgi:amicyanin
MNYLRFGVLPLAIVFIALSICLGASTTQPTAATPPPVTVKIENFSFEPRELRVAVGTTVTWINEDDVPHTATGEGASPAFDSKALDTDDRFSFTFATAGTYSYYCKVHPHMKGIIVVK